MANKRGFNAPPSGVLAVIAALAVAAVLSLSACQEYDLLRDMVSLDREYLMAIRKAKGEDVEKAIMSVKSLKMSWTVFKARHPGFAVAWAGRTEEPARLDDMVDRADKCANIGDLKCVASALEGARDTLKGLRRKNNFEYFPDMLSDFNGSLEPIMKALEDGGLSEPERDSLEADLRDALGAWKIIRTASIDREAYGLSKAAEKEITKRIEFLEVELMGLKTAFYEGGGGEASRAAAQIRVYSEEALALLIGMD